MKHKLSQSASFESSPEKKTSRKLRSKKKIQIHARLLALLKSIEFDQRFYYYQ